MRQVRFGFDDNVVRGIYPYLGWYEPSAPSENGWPVVWVNADVLVSIVDSYPEIKRQMVAGEWPLLPTRTHQDDGHIRWLWKLEGFTPIIHPDDLKQIEIDFKAGREPGSNWTGD